MALQETGRNGVTLETFDGRTQNCGLGFAPGQQGQFPGFQDRTNTHGDRVGRNILFAAKIASCISPSQTVERHHSRPGIYAGTRFIETDVPGPSNAKNLDIDPTRSQDFALVLLAVGKHFRTRDEAVRNVHIFWRNIDLIEKLHLHKVAITLRMMRRQATVFIEIESDNVPEREPFVTV